jgi:hypothetical protein
MLFHQKSQKSEHLFSMFSSNFSISHFLSKVFASTPTFLSFMNFLTLSYLFKTYSQILSKLLKTSQTFFPPLPNLSFLLIVSTIRCKKRGSVFTSFP